ncbi:hypothetical protein ABT160_42365 [Streptomyces sp. NPDC001941]|uniref:hypothetical protein n=1 Tax=Streptomyces sp. NPDC001941 TaxID=3154659 RepID=UPI0033188BA0
MPKNRSRAAALARQIQATSQLPYTLALACYSPDATWIGLADTLSTIGMEDAAAQLRTLTHVCAEAEAWYEASAQLESMYYDSDYARLEALRPRCGDAAAAALERAGLQEGALDAEAEVYHYAYLVLREAGQRHDGRALVRVALGVFSDDPLWCSDVIRSRGRAPFTYTREAVDGPRTPTARAARRAAAFLAAAADVEFRDDEEWYEAAALMVEAVRYASEAAGLPPFHGRPGYLSSKDDYDHGLDYDPA